MVTDVTEFSTQNSACPPHPAVKLVASSPPCLTPLSPLVRDTGTAGAGDHDDDLIFEDFARLRLKAGETEA